MSILLTADGLTSPAIEAAVLAAVSAGSPRGNTACIVTTAAFHKEKSNGAVATKDCLERLGFGFIRFLDVEEEDPAALLEHDVVYLNGGNPFRLLHGLRTSGALELLPRLAPHQLLVGTSAGALVLGPTLAHLHELNRVVGYEPMEAGELRDYTGAGLIPLSPLPHYNRFLAARPELELELQALECAWGVTLTPIRDGEALQVDGSGSGLKIVRHDP